jgi:hypothetical protein
VTKSTRFNTDAFEEYSCRLQTPIKLSALDFSLIIPNVLRNVIMETRLFVYYFFGDRDITKFENPCRKRRLRACPGVFSSFCVYVGLDIVLY